MTTKSSTEQPVPILLAGMHRSGTSMLADILTNAGLQTGCHRDPNGESVLFLQWNQWLLLQAGCRWDHPADWHPWINPLKATAAAQLKQTLQEPYARHAFFGKRFHAPDFFTYTHPWGWKDPRNTLTFPIWKHVFPQARALIMTRHGVDVAASLQQRATAEWQRWRPAKGPAAQRLITGSARCLSLDAAFSLWQEYQEAAICLQSQYPADILVIPYEKLLAEPQIHLPRIFTFCQLPEPSHLDRQLSLETARAFAYQKSPELAAFAAAHAPQLRQYGYEP